MTKSRAATLVAVLSVGFFLAWTSFGSSCIHRERNRAEIRALFHALSPGMTRDEARRVMSRREYPHLMLQLEASNAWAAEAPFEIGAKNWTLVVEFADDRVSALRIRTADGPHEHPQEAPPDRVAVQPMG